MNTRSLLARLALILVGTVSQTQAQQPMGDLWRARSPTPTGENLSSIALTPTAAVAVGNGTTVLTSPTGSTWTGSRAAPSTPIGQASRVAYSSTASKLLMISGTQFFQSTDSGSTWMPVDADLPEFGTITALSAAQGEFMVLQRNYDSVGEVNRLSTSADGITWTVRGDIPNHGTANQVTKNPTGLYVVVGNTYNPNTGESTASIWSTTDGITWDTSDLDAFKNLFDVLWTGTRFVAVGGTLCYRSTDGITWTAGGAVDNVTCMAKGGANLVALGSATVYSSTDEGQTWTQRTAPGTPFEPQAVTYLGSTWIAVGLGGTVHTSSSATAVSWIRRTPSGALPDFTSIAYNGTNLYIAMGTDDHAWYSTTGTSWSQSFPTFPDGGSVLWNGSEFILTGNFFATETTDANSWTSSGQFGPSNQTPDIMVNSAFSGGKYVAVGYEEATFDPVIYSGPAYDAFVKRAVPAGTGTLRAVTRGGSLWTIVGDGGTILTSADGNAWTKRSAGAGASGYDFKAVASNGSIIVAGGDGGYSGYYTSTNGSTWVNRTTLSSGFSSVIWTGSQFVAMDATTHTAQTSSDGINWTARPLPTSTVITSLSMSATELLGVGANRTMISSDTAVEFNFATATQRLFESNGTASVVLTLTSAPSTAVTVPLTVHASSTATVATDYVALPVEVTFASGEQTKILDISLVNDSTLETAEFFRIVAGTPTGARLGSSSFHIVEIVDDDAPPTMAFTRTAQTVPEHVGSVVMEVELSWPAPAAVSVNLTPSGSASAGSDYTAPASVSFATGEQRKSVVLSVTDDTDVESLEDAIFTLSGPTGGTLASSGTVYTLSIADNDPNTTPGNRWTLRQPLPVGEGWGAITSTASGFVAVGGGGTALTSSDGISWTRRSTGVAGNVFLNAVTSTTGLVIAAGDAGHVQTSTDGQIWTDNVVPGANSETALRAVATNGTRHVVAGGVYDFSTGSKPVIYSSSNGIHWTAEVLPVIIGSIDSVAWNGSQFVAVGTFYTSATTFKSIILSSTDGRTWVDRSSALPGVGLSNIKAIGSDFVAFDGTKNCYVSNNNPAVWTKRVAGTLGNVFSGAFGASKFIGVGTVTTSSTAALTTFTQTASPTKIPLFDIAFSSGLFAAIGGNSTLLTSPDGVTWTSRSSGIESYQPFLGATWAGTQFIAVGDYYGGTPPTLIATSPDGISWTERPNTLKKSLHSVAWNGTTAIAVGRGGAIVSSTNGITWTTKKSDTTLDLNSVIWARNQFIAVGGHLTGEAYTIGTGGSIVLTSPDGTTWTRRTVPTNHPLTSIVFTGSGYIAVGKAYADGDTVGDAVILTSPNAITWTAQTGGVTGADFTAIATDGAGKIVAVTSDYQIKTSSDGIVWTAATVPTRPTPNTGLTSIIFAGSQFVAGASDGSVLVSALGDTWTPAATELRSTPIQALAWNSKTLIAVGDYATAQTSGPGGALDIPTVDFAAAATSISESAGVANLLVKLSSPATTPVTVTLGTQNLSSGLVLTGAAADLTVPTLPLIFPPGQTEKYLAIPIKNDKLTEVTESLDIRLVTVTGGGILGSTQLTHALSITDDDSLPVVTAPASGLVTTGSPITLSVNVTGAGPFTFQWKKNGAAVPAATVGGKTATLYIHQAVIADGADYTCTVTNSNGLSATSAAARIVVYEQQLVPLYFNVLSSATVKVTQPVSANAVLHWFKDGNEVTTSLPTGVTLSANRATLTVTNVSANGGNYVCHIELPGVNSAPYATGNNHSIFATASGPGTSTTPSPMTGTVGSYFFANASTTGTTDVWSATGLPEGLRITPYGAISGFPEKAYTGAGKVVTFKAKNGVSTTTFTANIVINALPAGLAGTHTGLLDRDPQNNSNLGATVTLTVATNGYCTAAYTIGTTKASLMGRLLKLPNPDVIWQIRTPSLTGNPTAVVNGKIVELAFTFDETLAHPKGNGTITITPPGGSASAIAFTARQPLTGSTLASYVGRHTFALRLANAPDLANPLLPQGQGFGSATVATSGVITYTGKMGDGIAASVFTTTAPLCVDSTSPLYASLYTGKGSLMAQPLFTLGGTAPTFLDSTIVDTTTASWVKLPDTSAAAARTYPAGWTPLALKLQGSRYTAPTPAATTVVMGLTYTSGSTNANLSFGIPTEPIASYNVISPDESINIKPGGTIEPLFFNPRKVTFTAKPTDGSFGGTIDMSTLLLNDVPVPRPGLKYEGQIVRIIGNSPEQAGYGYLSLPLLPDITISPTPAATSTAIITTPVNVVP